MTAPLRILVHDYAGHPFQVQLSRELARRGHEVLHLFAASIQTPRGALERHDADPVGFSVRGIEVVGFTKHNYVRRSFQEWRYGRLLVAEVARFAPDVILSGNSPLDPQAMLLRHARAHGVRFVHWWQDVYSLAVGTWLRRTVPVVGGLAARYFESIERRIVRGADHVVAISDAFRRLGSRWGVEGDRLTVIPNWAPIEELPVKPKDNPWAREHGMSDAFVFMYTGTLGQKHNPELLVELAKAFGGSRDTRIVVISEGPVAEDLRVRASDLGLNDFVVLPFQDYAILAEVLGAADVLVAVLESGAGKYSVPSKVLTYLCAGRALLVAVPEANASSALVAESGAGRRSSPGDIATFVANAKALYSNEGDRKAMGRAARLFAERMFRIGVVADRFEAVLAPDTRGNPAADSLGMREEPTRHEGAQSPFGGVSSRGGEAEGFRNSECNLQ